MSKIVKIEKKFIGKRYRAWHMLGLFKHFAPRFGWSKEEIEELDNKVTQMNYIDMRNAINSKIEII